MAFVMLITCSLGTVVSFASDNSTQSETITIDGVTYRFEYSYSHGDKVTHIINMDDNTEDIVYYKKDNGTIYFNGSPMAYVETISVVKTENVSENSITPFASTGWRYHDTSTHRITWLAGTSASAVAAAISAAIPGTTTFQVILKMGLSALSSIAKSCIGGTLKCVAYTQTLADGKIQCRYDWTFTADSGDSYGPFSTYQL